MQQALLLLMVFGIAGCTSIGPGMVTRDRCKSNDPFDPIERLAKIRSMFFPKAFSWGQQTLSVTRQSDVSAFTQMVENARWTTQNILFVTVHVVSSNDNLRQNREATLEFFERNKANIAWINEAFAVAKRDGVHGMGMAVAFKTLWRLWPIMRPTLAAPVDRAR